jgi:molecular chaperone GrpE
LNAQTLAELQEAVAAAERVPIPADDESVPANLKTLVEAYDSLALAAREAERVRETILPALARTAAAEPLPDPAAAPAPRSWFARWFGGAPESATVAELKRELGLQRARLDEARQGAERIRRLLDSLLTGYTMSLQRLDRALRQNDLEPIPCVGEPFDPERMEALEVVFASGRSSGEVVDEVRRGYLRRDRVFRCAQVRVAKDSG